MAEDDAQDRPAPRLTISEVVAAVMAVALFATLIWYARAQRDRIVVSGFKVSDGPVGTGEDSEQLAMQFGHALLRLLNESDSRSGIPNYGAPPDPPDIELPGTGFSIATAIQAFAAMFGYVPATVSGHAIKENEMVTLIVRVSGPPLERELSITRPAVAETALPALINDIAQEVLKRVAPVTLAGYCRAHRGECEPSTALEYAVRHAPATDDPWALNMWAAVLIGEGRASVAEQRIKHALALDPDFPLAWFNYGTLKAASDPDVAMSYYRRAIAAGDAYTRSIAYNNLGQLTIVAAEKLTGAPRRVRLLKAKEAFLGAIRDNPRLADAYVHLGYIYLDQGQPDAAIGYYSRAAAVDAASPLPLIAWSIALEHTDRYDEGLPLLQTAAKIAPTDPQPAYYLGDWFARRERSVEALAEFQRALSLTQAASPLHAQITTRMAELEKR